MNDIESARALFAEHGYMVLEKEYVTAKTPMRYVCTCGRVCQVPLKRLKRGESGCKPCSIQRRAAKRRFDLEQVRKDFADRGYELLEEEYTSANIPLRYRCLSCGSIRRMRLGTLRQGNGCRICAQRAKAQKGRLGIDHAKKAFTALGLKLLEREYVSQTTRMRFHCLTCGTEGQTDLKSVKQRHGCKTCAIRKRSGPGHPRWIADRKERAFRKKVVEKCLGALKHCYEAFGTKKKDRAHRILGYTPRELREHIVNHPNWPSIDPDGVWHLDHVFPIKAFLDHGITDMKLINCLANLQPLPSGANLSKSGKYSVSAFREFLKEKGYRIPEQQYFPF